MSSIYDKTEQGHGHAFENMIKGGFPGSSNSSRKPTEKFDIEGRFDKTDNLPTSVKASKGKTIALADASTIFKIEEDFRLVNIEYTQKGAFKEPKRITEYIIPKEKWSDIKGDLPPEVVEGFHQELKQFKTGEHVEARQFARETKKVISDAYHSDISLNPKVDSKNQRRLQASISADVLSKHVTPNVYEAEEGGVMYRGVFVGKVHSTPRVFKKQIQESVAVVIQESEENKLDKE